MSSAHATGVHMLPAHTMKRVGVKMIEVVVSWFYVQLIGARVEVPRPAFCRAGTTMKTSGTTRFTSTPVSRVEVIACSGIKSTVGIYIDNVSTMNIIVSIIVMV